MQKQINLNGKALTYTLRKNSRAKNLRISIACDGQVSLTVPKYFPVLLAERFLRQKADWIFKKIEHFKNNKPGMILGNNLKDYLAKKERVRELIKERMKALNVYNFKYKSIAIKNQKTRWGSCSKIGNLNFNYKLVYLPPNLVDYVIIHELCHLKEMNHSPRFWALVERVIPDYKSVRKQLKNRVF
jgi:predicted metal-dependent hydrolase